MTLGHQYFSRPEGTRMEPKNRKYSFLAIVIVMVTIVGQSSCEDRIVLYNPQVADSTPTALILPDSTTEAKTDPALNQPLPKGIYPSILQSWKTYFTSRVAEKGIPESFNDQIQAYKDARAGNPISVAATEDPTLNSPTSKSIYPSLLQSCKTYFTSRVDGKGIFDSFNDQIQAFKDARTGKIL